MHMVAVGAEPTTITRYRRRGLIAAIVACGLPIVLVLGYFQVPWIAFPRTLSDENGLVSIDLPAGWYDETGNQRSIVRTESEGLVVEPDIRASALGFGFSRFSVVIDVSPQGKTADQLHQEAVQAQKRDYGAHAVAVSRSVAGGRSTTIPVPGWSSGEEFVIPDGTLVVRTLTALEYSVTIVGYTDAVDDPDGMTLLSILESARLG